MNIIPEVGFKRSTSARASDAAQPSGHALEARRQGLQLEQLNSVMIVSVGIPNSLNRCMHILLISSQQTHLSAPGGASAKPSVATKMPRLGW